MDSKKLLACLLLVSVAPAAWAATTVSLSSPTVRIDRDFRVQLNLSNTSDLYAAGVDLVYDPTKLTLADADGDITNGVQPSVSEGSLLNGAGTTPTIRVEALENGEPGRLVVGLTRRGLTPGASAPDERSLVSIGFRALTSGTTQVRLENIYLIDSQSGGTQPFTTSAGAIAVVTAVTNRAPAVVLAGTLSARPGLVILDGAQSSDPDGDALTYSWQQVTGAAVALSSTSAPAVTFRAVTEGQYGFRLRVSDGTATSESTVAVTISGSANTPPRALVVTPSRPGRGPTAIGYSLVDAEGDAADVTVEYTTDGTSFRPATRFAQGEGVAGLSAAPLGVAHQFVWNTGADLGATRQPAGRVRVTPRATAGQTAGTAGLSDPFAVDNTGLGITARYLEPLDGDTRIAGQPFRLRGQGFDLAGAAVTNLTYRASADGALGSGADISATLRTIGEQTLTLTATDAQQRTGTATLRVFVVPQPLPLRFTFAGRILSDQGESAPEGSQLVLFNPRREISGSGRVVGSDGSYEAVLGSLDKPVAGIGDTVTVEFVDASGVPRALTPGGVTLTASDLADQLRAQDFRFASQTAIALSRGLNLIAIPANPGTTATPYTEAELLRDTGASFIARVAAGRFHIYLGGSLAPALPVKGNESYLVMAAQDRTFSFSGRPWPRSERSKTLTRGINAIAFPGGFPSGFTSGDVLTLVSGEFLVDFEPAANGLSRARPFLRALDRAPIPLRPGRGYLVRTGVARTIELPSAIAQ